MLRFSSEICRRAALVLVLAGCASSLCALANRVFVSARSGNDANSCDNIVTPCQTFAGAVAQLNPGGEAIVLDSGGYGPVTITKSVTIEAPPGVLAFIHPPSGNAITINAGASDTVVLRGLVLNGGSAHGIVVNMAGTLSVEDCAISGFGADGINVAGAVGLNVKNTELRGCFAGIDLANTSGTVTAAIDHCHLDGNVFGLLSETVSPGGSKTTATNSTANNNSIDGWVCGSTSTGTEIMNLEFCVGSGNGDSGLYGRSTNASSAANYSNCVFSNNGNFGVNQGNSGTIASRGNNSITSNTSGPTNGVIGSFAPM